MADNKITEGTERLLEHLRYGERNAKTQNELAGEMGVTPLSVRQMVHTAKVIDHIVICNYRDGYGYFLPETQDEVFRMYKMTVRMGRAVFNQVNDMLHAMEMGGQMSLADIVAETEAI